MGRRRRVHEEHENHERWLVSYADFITLLFAFFAVLYATSQADVKKQEEFEKSIQNQFQKKFVGLMGMGGSESPYTEINDPRNNTFIRPMIESFPRAGAANQEVQAYVERKLDEEMSEEGEQQTVGGVRHDAVGVRIELAASRIFSSGSAELTQESARALDKLGKLLAESKRSLIVEGHTDNTPIRTKEYPSNWELSAARATKIVRYLAARHKIPGSRLTAVAYADQKPLAPNNSEANRARNRRIEIMIVTAKEPTL